MREEEGEEDGASEPEEEEEEKSSEAEVKVEVKSEAVTGESAAGEATSAVTPVEPVKAETAAVVEVK